ncbi:hypothetical protein ACFL6U_24610 [Planctomycetota bacterium]
MLNDVKPGEKPDKMTMKSMVPPLGLNKDYAYPKDPPTANAREYASLLNELRSTGTQRLYSWSLTTKVGIKTAGNLITFIITFCSVFLNAVKGLSGTRFLLLILREILRLSFAEVKELENLSISVSSFDLAGELR